MKLDFQNSEVIPVWSLFLNNKKKELQNRFATMVNPLSTAGYKKNESNANVQLQFQLSGEVADNNYKNYQ